MEKTLSINVLGVAWYNNATSKTTAKRKDISTIGEVHSSY